LDKLMLPGYELLVGKKVKNGITVTDLDVKLIGEHEHSHHEHDHHHDSHQEHDHHHKDHGHHHHQDVRNLKDIEELIDKSCLTDSIKDFSKKVFREIARAEAKVHNKDIMDVHFHEVGAVDSIVDIVGVAICLDMLKVEKVYSSPLHEGKGFIKCQHGLLPVPVPAVVEMLKGSGIPIITEDINTELVTPTGIGIIKSLTGDFGNMPYMKVEGAGYGLGKRDTGSFNALRVVLGNLVGETKALQDVAVLETNIDDMNSEALGFTMEKLFENGALDVFFTPVFMKKSRPGTMLTVISTKELEEKMVHIILKETTTIGVRRHYCSRYCMEREIVRVETELGEARVKVVTWKDIKKLSPEYEDCKELALKSGLPLNRVYEIVKKSAESLI
jgi:pyridinium-3,5-bisthiocarboxylic acid mononucleotide nickel chelatase